MEQVGKIKVVLICHFSSPQLRERLPLSSNRIYNFFRRRAGLNVLSYKDYANWNVNIINALSQREDIELHVISPHVGLRDWTHEFKCEGVSYYFYRAQPSFLQYYRKKICKSQYVDFARTRKIVRELIKRIKPDIVNLVGAENPYYSITVLDIEDMPIVLHCQTVYANPDRKKNEIINNQRWDVELQLFHHIPYIACTGRMYYELIKGYEKQAIIFPRTWPKSPFPIIPDVEKKYDFAYWARMLNRNKGFDNAIEAIGIVVKKYPELKVIAVGTWDEDKELFEQRIKELGLEKNIEIHPSFPNYTDMLHYVKKAKFALLPIKMDVLSGTILEAMRMGMPVVTCRTSGTPSLNEKRDTVLISDIGDNAALAQHMIDVLDNAELANSLKNNAKVYLSETDERDAHNVDTMVAQYKAIIAHYHNGTPIPQELLYNIEENIDYRHNENKTNIS